GRTCAPAVYQDGTLTEERWDPYRSMVGRTPVDQVEGIEIYHADRMELPARYRRDPCGVILVWTRPVTGGGGTESTLVKLGLVVIAGLVFFLSVAN
ncbi:MAG: hypothetical protein ACOCUW_01680, partial [Gemmatimonadota bacterium]